MGKERIFFRGRGLIVMRWEKAKPRGFHKIVPSNSVQNSGGRGVLNVHRRPISICSLREKLNF
jgi:hypothetical protein